METLLGAILDNNLPLVKEFLRSDRTLVTLLNPAARLYQSKIIHWLYAGDTSLHLAAAGHRVEIVETLLRAGADPNAAHNHRASGPLHYAADGFITGPVWDADRQVSTIEVLLAHGAKINLQDKNAATALHRATRTRCHAAVRCLIAAGSDPTLRNKSGSTPFHLAVRNTGRGGSGAPAAITAQRAIIEEFLSLGLSPALEDSSGKSVRDWAGSAWIRELLSSRR